MIIKVYRCIFKNYIIFAVQNKHDNLTPFKYFFNIDFNFIYNINRVKKQTKNSEESFKSFHRFKVLIRVDLDNCNLTRISLTKS